MYGPFAKKRSQVVLPIGGFFFVVGYNEVVGGVLLVHPLDDKGELGTHQFEQLHPGGAVVFELLYDVARAAILLVGVE